MEASAQLFSIFMFSCERDSVLYSWFFSRSRSGVSVNPVVIILRTEGIDLHAELVNMLLSVVVENLLLKGSSGQRQVLVLDTIGFRERGHRQGLFNTVASWKVLHLLVGAVLTLEVFLFSFVYFPPLLFFVSSVSKFSKWAISCFLYWECQFPLC